MPGPVVKQYKELEKHYVMAYNEDSEVEIDTAAQLYGKCKQIAARLYI